MKLDRLCENIEAELNTISDRGLNSNNMDTAQKLLDMYKNCKKVEYMKQEGSYQRGYSEQYSEGRNYGRDNYGRDNYGRDYNSYGYNRDSYSHGQDLVKELENVVRDISNPEDRQKVQKLIGKMRDM